MNNCYSTIYDNISSNTSSKTTVTIKHFLTLAKIVFVIQCACQSKTKMKCGLKPNWEQNIDIEKCHYTNIFSIIFFVQIHRQKTKDGRKRNDKMSETNIKGCHCNLNKKQSKNIKKQNSHKPVKKKTDAKNNVYIIFRK